MGMLIARIEAQAMGTQYGRLLTSKQIMCLLTY
jgi:hypothetical protein